jgi:hypothetical protein
MEESAAYGDTPHPVSEVPGNLEGLGKRWSGSIGFV